MRSTFTLCKSLCGGVALVVTLLAAHNVSAQISMGRLTTLYHQDFNSLPSSGIEIWESNTSYIPGWTVQRTNKSANTITAGTGSSNTGGLYSYGTSGSSERALGSISSSNAGEFTYNLLLQNDTGSTIKAIDVTYFGEQWRCGSVSTGEQSLTFAYAIAKHPSEFNLSPKATKGWVEVPEMQFRSKVNYVEGKTVVNGNLPEHRSFLTTTLRVDVPEGHYVMLRWKDADEPEMDHGLAIDDVTVAWSVEVNSFGVLPVELASFKGRATQSNIELEWSTASEENNAYFAVERSADAKQFEQIGQVAGHGTTAVLTHYTFADNTPLNGTAYYRLRQVDEDGTYALSKVISVNFAQRKEQAVKLYPTPATDQVQVELPGTRAYYALLVYDLSGRRVLTQQVQPDSNTHTLDVSKLRSGAYVLVLLDETGQQHSSRFLKR